MDIRYMEKIRNIYYIIRSIFKRFICHKSQIALPPKDYIFNYQYDFTQYRDYEWEYGPKWGEFHPKKLFKRYDMEGRTFEFTPKGILKMTPQWNPKTYKKSNFPQWQKDLDVPDEFTINHMVPRLHSTTGYRYGWFEAKIKLPKGKNLWPAFWLTGMKSWPPEIDILEAYSCKNKFYGNGLFKWWKLQPNLHYGYVDDNTKGSTGAVDIPVYKATERFVQYACLWEEDKILIYYDGKLVVECRDKEVLKWFNAGHNWMRIIVSMGLCQGEDVEYATMEVKDLKVYKK